MQKGERRGAESALEGSSKKKVVQPGLYRSRGDWEGAPDGVVAEGRAALDAGQRDEFDQNGASTPAFFSGGVFGPGKRKLARDCVHPLLVPRSPALQKSNTARACLLLSFCKRTPCSWHALFALVQHVTSSYVRFVGSPSEIHCCVHLIARRSLATGSFWHLLTRL